MIATDLVLLERNEDLDALEPDSGTFGCEEAGAFVQLEGLLAFPKLLEDLHARPVRYLKQQGGERRRAYRSDATDEGRIPRVDLDGFAEVELGETELSRLHVDVPESEPAIASNLVSTSSFSRTTTMAEGN